MRTRGAIRGWSVVITMLLYQSAYGQETSVASATADSVATQTVEIRSPMGAMVRSLLLPGWGQFYNKRMIKGSLVAAAEIGSAAALFVEASRGPDRATGLDADGRERLFVLTTIGIVFYSVVDAYVDAHLDMVDWGRVEADLEGKGVRAVVRIRF